MSPMLDRFVSEAPRAGHFTGLCLRNTDRDNQSAGGLDQYASASVRQHVSGVGRPEKEPACPKGEQVTTRTKQEQDLAHVGSWTSESLA